jgi:DNA-binding LacI/PurR family transcriptional regulator
VTIKDVARAAGVSPSTVCRALSTPDLVRVTTRQRVQQAAAALDYRPNRAARGLITGKTGNLGIIVPDLTNPFFPCLVKGAQARARESDYAVFLADTDEDPMAEIELVRALAKQVDGVILCSPRMGDSELRSITKDLRLVMINRRVGRLGSVNVDNADGMRQALTHLTALGHRAIGYVGGPKTSWSHRERLKSLRAVASSSDAQIVEIGNVTPVFEGGVAVADLVLATGVTAVIAYNDLVALGMVNRFAARGVNVPGDLSVVGCDDIPLAAMNSPALTTIALPQEQLGRVGVELLIHLMEHAAGGAARRSCPCRSSAPRRELATRLIVRGSTGPAQTD